MFLVFFYVFMSLKNGCSIRPGDQRIFFRGFPFIFCLLYFSIKIGINQFFTAGSRQRRGQDDNRRPIGTEPLQGSIHEPIHISIIGMAFIQNNYFSCQSQMPKHNMLFCQCCHQHLVNCPYNEICQQRLLFTIEPRVDDQFSFFIILDERIFTAVEKSFYFLIFFIEFSHTMS